MDVRIKTKYFLILLALSISISSKAQFCFAPRDFPTDSASNFIVTADFNHDNKPDLATTTKHNNISVLLNTGSGNMSTAVYYQADLLSNAYPNGLISADFNEDGNPDLATGVIIDVAGVYFPGYVGILLGNVNGTFQAPTQFAAGSSYPHAINCSDFNNDGHADIVIASSTDTLSFLYGDGLGNFSAPSLVATGTYSFTSIISHDFDNDGNVDIATLDSYNVRLFKGNGLGAFAAPVAFPAVPNALYSCGFFLKADVNADGKMDIITNISTLLGDGAGNFSAPILFVINSVLTTGDYNTDGNLDVVGANGGAHMNIATGNGAGNFTNPPFDIINNKQDLRAVVTADFNSDGLPDLATSNGTDNNVSVFLNSQPMIGTSITNLGNVSCHGANDGTAEVLVNGGISPYYYSWNTNPVQSTAVVSNLSGGTYTVTVTATNGCQLLQTVTINEPLALGVTILPHVYCTTDSVLITSSVSGGTSPYNYLWNTTPVQTSAAATQVSNGSYSVNITDANGCIVNSATLDIDQSLRFETPINKFVSNPQNIVSADFNGDAIPDLATLSGTSPVFVTVMLAVGQGNFSAPINYYSGNIRHLISTDMNNDGKADLTTFNLTKDSLVILYGNGNGGFPQRSEPIYTTPCTDMTCADFNSDNIKDFVFLNNSNTTMNLFLSNGSGGYAPAVTLNNGTPPESIITDDFNQDGKMDLATANYFWYAQSFSIYLGNGLGGFTKTNIPTHEMPFSITSGDYNNDSKIDIALVENTSGLSGYQGQTKIEIYKGNGVGSFTFLDSIPSVQYGFGKVIQSKDLNQDGNLDITTNAGTAGLSVLLGIGNGHFSSRQYVGAGQTYFTPVYFTYGDFDGDGFTDLATSNTTTNRVSVLRNCNTVNGIEEIANTNNVILFPNPTSGKFRIAHELKDKATIEVYNEFGIKIGNYLLEKNNSEIDLSNKPSGIYLIRLTENDKIFTSKLVLSN